MPKKSKIKIGIIISVIGLVFAIGSSVVTHFVTKIRTETKKEYAIDSLSDWVNEFEDMFKDFKIVYKDEMKEKEDKINDLERENVRLSTKIENLEKEVDRLRNHR